MKTLLTIFCVLCIAGLLKSQTLNQVEYFIDTDQGAGNNTKRNLTASADSSYKINIDVSGISVGMHKLYIRSKDNKGNWSFTAIKNIEVTASFNAPEITAGEYFFDIDPGYGNGKKITVSPKDTDITKNFAAIASSLNTGFHKLYVRFKDNSGKWALTSRRNIEVIKTADTIKITEAEYFFTADKGYDNATTKVFPAALEDGKFKLKIPYNKIPAGTNVLFLRVKDSLDNWSLTKLDSFTVESFAQTLVASEQVTSDNNGLKRLTVFPNPASQNINISFQSKNKSAPLQIFDVNGNVVLQKNVRVGTTNNIDISTLAAGSYIVQLNDAGIIRSDKFIKQ